MRPIAMTDGDISGRAKALLFVVGLVIMGMFGALDAVLDDEPAVRSNALPAQHVAFELNTTDGSRITSVELAGKPTILWFWAPWCPYSQDVADEVAAEAKLSGDSVRFVGIGGRDTLRSMKRFVRNYDVAGIEHGVDLTGDVAARFGVTRFPTFVALFPDGYYEKVDWVGDRETLHELVESLEGWASANEGIST